MSLSFRLILGLHYRHLLMMSMLMLLWGLLLAHLGITLRDIGLLPSMFLGVLATHPLTIVSVVSGLRLYAWYRRSRRMIEAAEDESLLDAHRYLLESERVLAWFDKVSEDRSRRDEICLSYFVFYTLLYRASVSLSYNVTSSAVQSDAHGWVDAFTRLSRGLGEYVFRCASVSYRGDTGSEDEYKVREEVIRRATERIGPRRLRSILERCLILSDRDGAGFLSTASFLYSIAVAMAIGREFLETATVSVDDAWPDHERYGWLWWRSFSYAVVAAVLRHPASRITGSIRSWTPPVGSPMSKALRYDTRHRFIRERSMLLRRLESQAA
jgi:hypothetical protein